MHHMHHKHQAKDRRTVQERRHDPDMAEAESLATDAYTSFGPQRVVNGVLWADHPEIWDTTS